MNIRGTNVLVLGMGETGLSIVRWLLRAGAHIRVADSRTAPPCLGAIRKILPADSIYTGGFAPEAFLNIGLITVSPGVAVSEPAVQQAASRGIPVMGDVELFALAIEELQFAKPKIVAITGSNGKTTVTAMVGSMLKNAGWDAEVAGNIGPAVLDVLMERLDSGKLPQVWVLELSSFQLETTHDLYPDAATVLNLSEDHFDRYAGMQDYASAKARIFHGETDAGMRSSGGVQVINRDDVLVRAMALPGRKRLTFGLGLPAGEDDFGLSRDGKRVWLTHGDVRLMEASELRVSGLHNVANALAALALCRALALPFEPLLQALREFKGLPHRMERVASYGGVCFYDDSKGTNVGATVAALDGAAETVVLIAGGDGKGQDFSPLVRPVAERARAVVLIGRDAGRISEVLRHCGKPVHFAETMEEAVRSSFLLAHEGDAILLSPACASFDMFKNYVHRAQSFVAAVNRLQTESSAVRVSEAK
jgi:UDP-N-acetylmuramoylalanine--D-glutamate ligase